LVFVVAMSVSAGTIRHDRDPSLYLAGGGLSDYASVGRINGTTTSYSFAGSGTLIADDWVLTAGHVVDQATSLTFDIGGSTYSAAKWLAYPKWNNDLLSGYDIGMLQLSSPVSGITPAERYAGSDELGLAATFVGFGMTGTGLTGATVFDGKKRAGNNVIDALYSRSPKKAPSIFLSDFDNPLDPLDNAYGSSTPLDLEYLIAPGDSGGGVFVDLGAGPILAGVNSFVAAFDGDTDSDYGDVSGHIRVSMFNNWIDSVISGGGGGKGGNKGGGRGHTGASFNEMISYDSLSSIDAVPEPVSVTLFALAGWLAFAVRRR
jgi:hypothetical protein